MYQLLSVNRTGGAVKPRPRISFFGEWLYDIGFIPNALVQVLPEPDGMVFNLCNEGINNYSDLFHSTRHKGGNLIRVYLGDARDHEGPTFVTSGKYIYSGGLADGDALIAKYDCGVIRVRKIDPKKLGYENVKVIPTTSIKNKHTGSPVPKVRLYGDWLNEIGFLSNSLVLSLSEKDSILFQLRNEGIENYGGLVRYARQNGMKLIQVREEANLPVIGITGSCVSKACFDTGDMLVASYQHGVIKLQKLNPAVLGF